MSEKSETTVIGSLPRSRPQRRSDKRAPRPTPEQTTPPTPTQAAPPVEEARPNPPSTLPDGAELLGTVVKAGFELAEIGMTVGARALRTAVSRLPRP
jgi:hypothetical protein